MVALHAVVVAGEDCAVADYDVAVAEDVAVGAGELVVAARELGAAAQDGVALAIHEEVVAAQGVVGAVDPAHIAHQLIPITINLASITIH